MDYKTENDRREDLEIIGVNQPENYITGMIFPPLPTLVKSGKVYFKTVVADSAAQTDRPEGTAPATVLLGNSNQNYTCTEKIKRYGVPYSRVKEMGGIDKADRLGGAAAKRSVMRELETERAELLLTTGAATDVETDFLGAVRNAKKAVKRYTGKLVLVCSQTAFDTIMELDQIKERLTHFNAVRPADNEQALSMDRGLLAMIIKVEDVLIGDDDHFARTTTAATPVDLSIRAAVVKIAPAVEESQDMDAVFAKTMVYLPDGEQEYEITSFPNDEEETNKYTAKGWVDYMTFNAGACCVLDGIDATANA